MRNFLYQVKINFTRIILRNKRFLFFNTLMPSLFYLLYTKVIPVSANGASLDNWQKSYLISMIVYACLLGSIFTVSNTLLEDQTSHFNLLVKISPLPLLQYYCSMIVVFITLNFLSSSFICLIGILVNHISLSLPILIFVLLVSVVGTIPLIMIGIIIPLLGSSNTVNTLNNLITFPLAIISGLWWPMEIMPKWIQTIGKLTPTYSLSKIDDNIIFNANTPNVYLINIITFFIIISIIIVITFHFKKHQELIIQ